MTMMIKARKNKKTKISPAKMLLGILFFIIKPKNPRFKFFDFFNFDLSEKVKKQSKNN
jgi:hypothetical protein